ncbi:hypothetical protein E1091_00255 [Micromonospora fluostatini]|uniref:Uncharacterized protein n=1 Tax=Micromonospora fluostatini TaxID=1629071 RepID=A0ABY2DMA3_9ACTN|nr:hypothetical protein E1091_00255 [Micromonospora fluostatini]
MGDYTVSQDDLVYLANWTPGVFRVSMNLPDGRVVVAAHPDTEAGIRGEVGSREVWPAVSRLHGKEMLRGEVVMASPLRGREGWVVLLTQVGAEYVTGLISEADLAGDKPEWGAGRWFKERDQAVHNLRVRSGWSPA